MVDEVDVLSVEPTKRPGSVTGASVLLMILGGLFALVGVIGCLAGAAQLWQTGGAAYAGMLVLSVVQLVVGALALTMGMMLRESRSKNVAIGATVVSVLLLVSCVGAIATFAVPLLLWEPEDSRAWLSK